MALPRTTSSVLNFRHPPEFEWRLGVVAKRTYDIVGRKCVLAANQGPLITPDDPNSVTGGGSFRDKDTYGFKVATDVVIHGSAYAFGSPATKLDASVEVGELRRTVRVHGDRQITAISGSRPVFSEATPFESMPLTYERSYGGFDEYSAKAMGDPVAEASTDYGVRFEDASKFTYPRNARGCGFFIDLDVARTIGSPVPNLEDPEDPVLPERMFCETCEHWILAPIPGSLDWMLPSDFPRSAHFNLLDDHVGTTEPIREVVLGAIAPEEMRPHELLDPIRGRATSGAAPGLGTRRLKGDEEVRLMNMHPELPELVFRLPPVLPTLTIQPPGCPIIPLEPALDTVYIEPHRNRLSLVWSGSIPVACRYPEHDFEQVKHGVQWS